MIILGKLPKIEENGIWSKLNCFTTNYFQSIEAIEVKFGALLEKEPNNVPYDFHPFLLSKKFSLIAPTSQGNGK